jgi:hypothetical protein
VTNGRIDDSFFMSFYRKNKMPWDDNRRPVVVIHFYVMPDLPSDHESKGAPGDE